MHRLLIIFLLLCSAAAATASADEIVLRGNYWRDRNTRVVAPEAEFSKDLPSGTTIGGGYLLDAITSASVAAGVLSDQPFTELRNQVSLKAAQRLGPVTVGGNYRYSTESDYWAHVAGGTVALDLAEKNLSLAASVVYSHGDVARRSGPTGFIPVGHLNSWFGILTVSQVLSPLALADASLELSRLGDASDKQSFQQNPYRTVKVAGSPMPELEPLERNRITVAGGLRLAAPQRLGALRHLSFYLKYRFYHDDWGMNAHAPELRTYLRLGPVEFRVTGRYYHQNAVAFWPRDRNGQPLLVPEYDEGVSFRDLKDPNHCKCFTGDAKLSEFASLFLELRVSVPLAFLDRAGVPIGRFLGASTLALSYGHYFNDRFAHLQYGDADVAGMEWIFPL